MEEYSSVNQCIKCENVGCRIVHRESREDTGYIIMFNEFLMKTCNVCGYSWKENTADYKES